MNFNRRSFFRLGVGGALLLDPTRLLGQGVSTHTAKPLARPAPSGRPFNSHFVDVAAAAGLDAPVIYGDEQSKKYIVEIGRASCREREEHGGRERDSDKEMEIHRNCGRKR